MEYRLVSTYYEKLMIWKLDELLLKILIEVMFVLKVIIQRQIIDGAENWA